MSLTVSNRSGTGGADAFIDSNVELPDTGTSIGVGGSVQSPGLAGVTITGSPLTAPAVPGTGSIFWNIQVDVITGAATVQQSTSADPAALLSSDGITPQVVIFRQTLVAGSTSDDALQATDSTPDQPV